MAVKTTKFGPGTITVGATPTDFSCEVLGGVVQHEYEEVQEARTVLCGDVIPATVTRTDGVKFQLVNDLTATGLYAYLHANDLTTQPIDYTPNTADGASWAGTVQVKLPAEVGADEFNADIESEVEWDAIGPLTFTPSTGP